MDKWAKAFAVWNAAVLAGWLVRQHGPTGGFTSAWFRAFMR
jgi:hypothetical protein